MYWMVNRFPAKWKWGKNKTCLGDSLANSFWHVCVFVCLFIFSSCVICRDPALKFCSVLHGPLAGASAWQFLGCLCWKTSLNGPWWSLVSFVPEWDCPCCCCCRLMIWTQPQDSSRTEGHMVRLCYLRTGGWWNLGYVACDFQLPGLKQGTGSFCIDGRAMESKEKRWKILRKTKDRREAALRVSQSFWLCMWALLI